MGRIRNFGYSLTSIHDNDVLAVDTGAGSSNTDRTWKLTWANLKAALAAATMSLINKTLVSPTINGGMTVGFTSLVAGLNADRVDNCHVGPDVGSLPQWGTAGQSERLDEGFQDQVEATYLRSSRGMAGITTIQTSGTLNLTSAMLGVLFLDLTAAATVNLPTLSAANAGASMLIAHRAGSYVASINTTGGQNITDLKDSLGIKEIGTVGLTAVGSSILLVYDGIGHWLVTGGRGFTGLE